MAMSAIRIPLSTGGPSSEARRAALGRASDLGFDATRAGEAAIVASELATNIIQHTGGGEILIQDAPGSSATLEVLAIDRGPGIEDVSRALRDGYSTAGTLGHGLGSVIRQSDEFGMFSRRPGGTVALARLTRTRTSIRNGGEFLLAGVCVARAGEPVSGDAWMFNWRNTQGEVMVADGLGHGVAAAEASTEATRAFKSSRQSSPSALIEELHLALRPTRGAAVAVASLDLEKETAKFAGLGNIGALILSPDGKRTILVSQNGTAGHAARRISEFSYPFRQDSILILFSDGLASNWDPAAYPGLWTYDPAIIAAVLYRDFSRQRDDVTVVVGKTRPPR
jgi:anti-sigma regulatory factor (Ser/Thr protein kinase)